MPVFKTQARKSENLTIQSQVTPLHHFQILQTTAKFNAIHYNGML